MWGALEVTGCHASFYRTASPSAMLGCWLTEEEEVEGRLRWREVEVELERGEGLAR